MHQPRLPHKTPLQGLPAPQAPSMTDRQAKERKRRRSSNRERGHVGQGFEQLKNEVIRPDAYRPKDNNDALLSKRLEQLCRFFPKVLVLPLFT